MNCLLGGRICVLYSPSCTLGPWTVLDVWHILSVLGPMDSFAGIDVQKMDL